MPGTVWPLDERGCPSGSVESAAREALSKAVWRMMSFYDVPLADLDRAQQADPDWAMPHVARAGFLASLTEPSLQAEAQAHLAAAQACTRPAPLRERAHLSAVGHVLQGRWGAAARVWDELLVLHPRDALALQWSQLADFHAGDLLQLRQRPARALPEWDDADPLRPYVMALYAFGLEENHLHAQAEEVARQALALEPRVPWAIHAVAHVMEMQGRHEEGSAWLAQHQPVWTEGNGFACHLWWHKGLFRLEGLDRAGALRLVDSHLSGPALQITLNRVDAAALLWRLHLLDEDVSALASALVDGWTADPDRDAGFSAFNDLHHTLACLAAGRVAAAESWVARCAARVLAEGEARRDNHAVARRVGLPLMRALLAFGRGRWNEAVDGLYAHRSRAQALGGSHAQRDLVDLTLMAAAARAPAGAACRASGRAVLNERLLARAETPLTRHWIDALHGAGGAP